MLLPPARKIRPGALEVVERRDPDWGRVSVCGSWAMVVSAAILTDSIIPGTQLVSSAFVQEPPKEAEQPQN